MSTPSQRLAQLGLELPPVAAPVAAYQPAARLGNQVVTSGQLEDGRRTVEIFTAIYRSQKSGQPVKFPLAPDPSDLDYEAYASTPLR